MKILGLRSRKLFQETLIRTVCLSHISATTNLQNLSRFQRHKRQLIPAFVLLLGYTELFKINGAGRRGLGFLSFITSKTLFLVQITRLLDYMRVKRR